VPTHVGRDFWHLNLVDLIIPVDHIVQPVFPVHGHKGQAVVIPASFFNGTIYL